ncbi:MAG: hypothetical protein ACE5ER_04545 [Nitrospinaceae bacterium]
MVTSKTPPSEDKLNLIYFDHQDPIQLKDLIFYLYRNWKACLVISFLVFLAVILVFVFTTPKYQFKMALEIGHIGFQEGIGRTLIDPLPKIKQSIKEIYIPRLRDDISSKSEDLSFPKISIKTIRESNLVMLKAIGTLEQGPEIINFLERLKESILTDHNKEIVLFIEVVPGNRTVV